jgi:hypothetical protein
VEQADVLCVTIVLVELLKMPACSNVSAGVYCWTVARKVEQVRWNAVWIKTGKEDMFVLQDGCLSVQYEGRYCTAGRTVV